jgi:phage terminase large subunit-like protein
VAITSAKQHTRGLSDQDILGLAYDWRGLLARPSQLAPLGEWSVWMVLAGRGFGKTRTGAEWVREQIEVHGKRRIALVARTSADARDVMVEGESGILAVSPPWNRPIYEPSKRRLTWPNGAMATTYSADEPNLLRGPQHDAAWADELAAWQYPDAWDQLLMGLRLGDDPRVVVTTTPRPTKLIRELLSDPASVLTRGSTFDNAPNLAKRFLDRMRYKYEGTRLGRQELNAEILDDTPGALWTRNLIDASRVRRMPCDPARVVVAVDPATRSADGSDERGIIVAALGTDGHAYVLADESIHDTPERWARQAVIAYHNNKADRVVAEVNQGGDLVETVIRTVEPSISFSKVHATKGKITRAEPVSALYEQKRVHHVGQFAELEDQMCTWVQGDSNSPDRMDALVWAITELLVGAEPPPLFWRA